jgi:hypothetical protein
MSSPDYSGGTSCAPPPVHRAEVGVRRDRLLFAVADHVDLVEGHLMLVVEIPLDRLGALEPELVVQIRGTRVVRVTFDFDVCAVRLGLELLHERIDVGLGLVGHDRLAELEAALVLAERHFVDEALRRALDLIGTGVHRGRRGARFGGTLVGGVRALARGHGALVDFADLAFVRAGTLLGLFDRLRERFDFAVHFPDLRLHHLLGRTGGRAAKRERKNRYDEHEFLHLVLRAMFSDV